MAEKIVIEAEVKSNIGEVSKDASNASSEFKVMGISLNGIKRGFASAAITAKGMFGSIKAGLISTGIGAFVVLVGSLISYFTKTKRGAEMLERALVGFGAVVSVITDLFSSLGESAVAAFEDPKKAVAELWEFIKKNLMNRLEGVIDAFKALGKVIESAFNLDWDGVTRGAKNYGKAMVQIGTGMDVEQQKAFIEGVVEITDEMQSAADAAMRLKGILQNLRDEERKFSKVKAQTRQDIQKARLEALDDSKTAEERLAALQKANDLELGTTAKSLEMQKTRIKVQKEVMALSENMAEDLDELAALEVELIDLQTQSFQTQKRLATEMETLTNEIAADAKAKRKEAQDLIDEEWDAKIKANDEWNKEQQANAKAEIALAKEVADAKNKIEDELATAKKKTLEMGAAAAMKIAGEGSAVGKSVAVAMAVMNTKEAVTAALGATPYGPWNIAQAIATGVFGMTQVQGILSTPIPGGGGGGSAGVVAQPPAPQMMSGAFDISGGVAPEAMKAYVITDEMSSSQNQLANIRRRATI